MSSETRGRQLGEILVARGLVPFAEVERALEVQARIGGRLGQVLVRVGALSEDVLVEVLAEQLDLPLAGRDIPWPEPSDALATLEMLGLRPDWAIDQQVMLWSGKDGAIVCASRDPLSPALGESLRTCVRGSDVRLALARSQEIERYVEDMGRTHADRTRSPSGDASALRELAEEAPTVEFVNNLLAQAAEQRASDIHVEPEENGFVVRFRIDGVLQGRLRLPKERFAAATSRLKLISGMDIAERRLPQDGRFSARVGGQEMDVRASALPGVHGESMVLRLLPKERRELGLDQLGFAKDHLALMNEWVREANGIVLVTGPTGSGKSTTLYSSIAASNDGLRKIITVEDPVEFQLPGVTQIQTHAEIGLTFAKALRSILRQDPDVIMIGEIRDLETAEIAVQASLTGHLVLSTLHTNDAIGAFTRLVDMGVEPFLVATPLKAVQAQRLVRRLCACSKPATPPAEYATIGDHWAHVLGDPRDADWREPVGCPKCLGTGYRGRLGIYELVPVSTEMQHLIVTGANASSMRALAVREGARFLREDGLLKARQGLTSIEEVLRVTGH
jgi:general secretion pathway protein E